MVSFISDQSSYSSFCCYGSISYLCAHPIILLSDNWETGAYWTPPTSRLFGGCHTNARLSGVVWSGITIWGCQVGYHDLGLTGRASESATSRSGVGIWGWHLGGHKNPEKTVFTKFSFLHGGCHVVFVFSDMIGWQKTHDCFHWFSHQLRSRLL